MLLNAQLRRDAVLLLGFWTLPVALGFGRYLLFGPNSPQVQTPGAALLFYVSLWYPWALLTPIVWALGRRLHDRKLRWYLAGPSYLVLGLAVALAYSLLSTPGRFLASTSPPYGLIDGAVALFVNKSHVPLFVYSVVLCLGLMREARTEVRPAEPERIAVKTSAGIVLVDVDDIDFVSAADQYVEIHVNDRALLWRESMAAMEQRLPQDRFYRIHRSTIVNLSRIDRLKAGPHGEYTVTLRNGRALRASRGRSSGLRRMLAV